MGKTPPPLLSTNNVPVVQIHHPIPVSPRVNIQAPLSVLASYPYPPCTSKITSHCEYVRQAKTRYKDLFPEGRFLVNFSGCNNQTYVTAKKGNKYFFLSVMVGLFVSLFLVFSADTTIFTCEDHDDSSDEDQVCLESGERTLFAFFAALFKLPWIIILYKNTGLWFNQLSIIVTVKACRQRI